MLDSTSSMAMSSLSVLARSCECSVMTCSALVIITSVSSVLPDTSLSVALSRGKQKEKAGADSGATSDGTSRHESGQYCYSETFFTLVAWFNSRDDQEIRRNLKLKVEKFEVEDI